MLGIALVGWLVLLYLDVSEAFGMAISIPLGALGGRPLRRGSCAVRLVVGGSVCGGQCLLVAGPIVPGAGLGVVAGLVAVVRVWIQGGCRLWACVWHLETA